MSKFEMVVFAFVVTVAAAGLAFLVSPYFDGAPGDQLLAAAIMTVDAMK